MKPIVLPLPPTFEALLKAIDIARNEMDYEGLNSPVFFHIDEGNIIITTETPHDATDQ